MANVSYDMLLHPELLTSEQLIAIILERHLRVPNMESMPRDELLELFHQYCVPYAQRRYRDTGRGKILNKTRHIGPESTSNLNVFNDKQIRKHLLMERIPSPDLLSIPLKRIKIENKTVITKDINEFKRKLPIHNKPIGLQTTSSGFPVDVRDTVSLNTDVFLNNALIDLSHHFDSEKIPERVVFAKGTAALGHFEVTNDVSMYTKADVFNGVGKITPIVGRFSSVIQNKGGTDLGREAKGMAVKFYTHEGNLDLMCINYPIGFINDPYIGNHFVYSLKRNPKTQLFDNVASADFVSLRAEAMHALLWQLSDYGIPNGYRKMDAFVIHTYVVNNKHGENFFVKFNFRTLQGIENISPEEAFRISGLEPDYYNRDMYNAIATKNYPMWKLEMDVMSYSDILKVDFNPFDLTVLWKNGTYHTVEIGKIIFTKNPDNMFRVSEQVAFNPANLVPGIPGPYDPLFQARRVFYHDTQKHRLGSNFNRIDVNRPKYDKVYNRNGQPPVEENMRDIPNYYPNSFSGPIPFVDATRPKRLFLLERNAVDLGEASYFYNHVLYDEEQRFRLAANAAVFLVPSPPFIQDRVIELFGLIDPQLAASVKTALDIALNVTIPIQPLVVYKVPMDKRV